ncbi:MAG TPA: hypothetical protein PKD09_06820 [Aggregatilinea sp.]|jgi:ABC-type methionine transport system permease subunit|uniref:hypothetical protein n=1 Tax=Aggregatilinea sp. TaxID=2806333 RepID=UPI002C3D87E6|nr:hypothetical protein [Aggregatilinea sp.]HML21339.1 hypothetical protein [Aggregatilinea sp.]
MGNWLLALLFGVMVGLALGVKIAQDSNKKQPVRGGAVAQTFHYLACAAMMSVLPFIILGIVLGLKFLVLFGTGLGLLALTGLCLLLEASIERGAAAPPPDRPVLTD